jgi:hypothetical protein
MLKQFDVIQIITTRRIRYLSAPSGSASSPQGDWNVIGMIENDVIAAKNDTMVRVPLADVRKVGSYNLDAFLEQLFNAGYRQSDEYNVTDSAAKMLGIDIAEARQFLIDHTLKTIVKSASERDQILRKALELWQKQAKKT